MKSVMNIKEFIIHHIDKDQHKDPKVHLRKRALLVSDSRVIRFTAIALEVFKANEEKPSSVYADFNTDTANYPFSEWCLNYFRGHLSFLKLTTDSTNRLANSMKRQQLSTGGFVVFTKVDIHGEIKLLVMMLHPQDGLSVTSDLEFEEVTHLELKHIDKAALITAPVNGKFGSKPVTYAGFRKKMSQYFQEFIGPDAFRNPNKDSSQLIDALEDYAKSEGYLVSQLDGVRIDIRNYAKKESAAGRELDLSVLSSLVDPANPQKFKLYAANRGISGFIKPDSNVFRRWKLVKHKSEDGLEIQFKAEMVGPPGTNHRLELDTTKRTLTIRNVEDSLISKIKNVKS